MLRKVFQIPLIFGNLVKRFHNYVPTTNYKYNLSYSLTQHWRKWKLRRWLLCFRWCSFFSFSRAEKQLIHISSFRSTSYVLNSFGCSEFRNSASNRNKDKKLVLEDSIFQIWLLKNPVFIFILMYQSLFWISVSVNGFFEFNRVAIWKERETLLIEGSAIQKCQMEIPVSIFQITFQISVFLLVSYLVFVNLIV